MTIYSEISDKVINDPFGIDQHNALNDNTKALREQSIRSGTAATPIRLVFARGSFAFDETLSGGLATASQVITYSSDATDGDPNFGAVPVSYCFGLKEDGSGVDWGGNNATLTPYVVSGTGDANGMTVEIRMVDVSAGTDNIKGICYWFVWGDPTGAE
jgi:hypothetical protein